MPCRMAESSSTTRTRLVVVFMTIFFGPQMTRMRGTPERFMRGRLSLRLHLLSDVGGGRDVHSLTSPARLAHRKRGARLRPRSRSGARPPGRSFIYHRRVPHSIAPVRISFVP